MQLFYLDLRSSFSLLMILFLRSTDAWSKISYKTLPHYSVWIDAWITFFKIQQFNLLAGSCEQKCFESAAKILSMSMVIFSFCLKPLNVRKDLTVCQNCHFYSYILIVRDAKFFACLESFSSKLNCVKIEIFGTVSSVF